MERNSGYLIMLAAVGMLISTEVANSGDCGCAAAACCGPGTGLAQIAGVYSHHGVCSHHRVNGHHGVYGQYPYSGSFLSGYEGLPNMDGGGVHYRYPYHSYRRPWFHPGPPSTNISIVW